MIYQKLHEFNKHYMYIALDFENEWFDYAGNGNLEGMKKIYETMKERGVEAAIKGWRRNGNSTILTWATSFGRPNILEWVIKELEIDVNEQNSSGWTALHVAAYYNQLECVRVLLRHKPLLLKSRQGNTPLDDAKIQGHKGIEHLIQSHFQIRKISGVYKYQ